MSDVTRVLSVIEKGDPLAADQLLPLVYDELRALAAQNLASEKPGQTLQATALVHEAYLRLVGSEDPGWNGRNHFFAAAAEAMRRVLINRARDRGRLKRGGDRRRVDLEDLCDPFEAPDEALLELDAALDRLTAAYPRPAQLVKLRFFGGLSLEEAAATLGVSTRTANREWTFARVWLRDALGRE
ncbi:MAG: sigma-70 family RNA polymerase sigma factor [Planctomycetes bacterium]|nr:sigma-70 family RNA polymerase sigma factor [Planctomycetota bacterium]